MKMPTISWPFGDMDKTAELRGWRLVLLLLAVLLVSFLISLYLFFPTDALKEQILSRIAGRVPARIDMQSLEIGFPPALQGGEIDVSFAPEVPYSLTIDELNLSPEWSSLLGSNPGIDFNAVIAKGNITGTASKDGDLQVTAQEVPLSVPLLQSGSLQLAATIANANFSGKIPLQKSDETLCQIDLRDIILGGLDKIGFGPESLSLGTAHLKVTGQRNSFKIEDLSLAGGALQASGSGTMMLSFPLQHSRINLNLVLRPSPTLDKNLVDMLKMFAKPADDGSLRLRLSGTLSRPVAR